MRTMREPIAPSIGLWVGVRVELLDGRKLLSFHSISPIEKHTFTLLLCSSAHRHSFYTWAILSPGALTRAHLPAPRTCFEAAAILQAVHKDLGRWPQWHSQCAMAGHEGDRAHGGAILGVYAFTGFLCTYSLLQLCRTTVPIFMRPSPHPMGWVYGIRGPCRAGPGPAPTVSSSATRRRYHAAIARCRVSLSPRATLFRLHIVHVECTRVLH